MAGMITAVAVMIGMSPAMLAHHLPLTDEIEQALDRGTGPLGRLLRMVEGLRAR